MNTPLSILSGVGFAVPMEISLYICLESALIITPLIFFANLIAMLDLPDAVVPAITMIGLLVILKDE